MPVVVRRPNSTLQTGNWVRTGGTTLHGVLSDNTNATYISVTGRAQNATQVAIVDIADLTFSDIPDGAKIYSVRTRVTVEQTTAPAGNSLSFDIIRFYGQLVETVVTNQVTGSVTGFIRTLLSFLFPLKPPSQGVPAFQTVQLDYKLEKPAGGEWTTAVLNAMTWTLGISQIPAGFTAKISEYFVDIDFNERPVVDVTAPTSPVTTTTRPVVTWTFTDPESDLQEAYRVRVFTAAQVAAPGFDIELSTSFAEIGWTPGAGLQWLVNRDLPNGVYRAYVQARQVWKGLGEHRSQWDYIEWTQTVVGPPAPSLAATPENTVNWVQLDLTAGVGAPATESYNIEFSDNAGIDYDLMRGGYQVPVDGAGAATVFDYTAPLGRARLYRAYAYRTLGTVKVSSVLSNTASAVPAAEGWWFKDLISPSLNFRVIVLSDEFSQEREQGIFAPLAFDESGVTCKFVVNGVRHGIEGEIELGFKGPDATSGYDAWNRLYGPGRTVLFQYPTGEQHFIQFGESTDVEWKPKGDKVLYRRVTVRYIEVTEPIDPTAPTF